MANPQLENGYTQIADELVEAWARTRIPGEARQVYDVILRKTYGFNKKADCISLSQFSLATGLKKPHVCRALNVLRSMNLIAEKDNDIANMRRINKDFDSWKPLPRKITVAEKGNNRYRKRESSLPKKGHTIKTLTKKTSFVETSEQFRLADLLFTLIRERNPAHKPPNLQSWAKSIDLMIRRDDRKSQDIECVIRWSQQDAFWQNNILSTSKLRRQFDQLFMKMQQESGDSGGTSLSELI